VRAGDLARRLLPWAGSAVLVTYMIHTTDLRGVGDALAAVDLPLLALLMVAATAATFVTDAAGVAAALRAVFGRASLREVLPAKATSYFLNILNYNAALAGMALVFHRSRGVGFWRAAGALMLVNVVDLLGVLVLLAAGLAVNAGCGAFTEGLEVTLRWLAWGGLAAFLGGVAWFRSGLPLPLLGGLRRRALFAPLREVSRTAWIRLLGLRLLLLGQYLAVQWALLRLFGVPVPARHLLAYVPVLTFLQIVPISISGLGTTQLAAREFYGPFVATAAGSPHAVVDAATTAGIAGFLVLRILLGYLFLGDLSRDILRGVVVAPPPPTEDKK